MTSDLIKIGKTKKPHGIKGELKLHLDENYEDDFYDAKVIFVNTGGGAIPFWVEAIRGDLFPILKLEGVDDRSKASEFSHKDIFMRNEDIVDKTENINDLQYQKLKGYALIDESLGNLGQIEAIIEMPQQEMAVLNINKKETLIPLNNQLIVEINDKSKTVKMDLPTGLVGL